MIVHVTVKKDAVFERDGYDVYVRVPITYSQAVLGAEIEVPTVDGKVPNVFPKAPRAVPSSACAGRASSTSTAVPWRSVCDR